MSDKRSTLPKDAFVKGFLLLVGLGIAGYIGLIVNERHQFNQAEKQIDDIYAQIVQAAGEPDQTEKIKRCGYSSAKFSKGRLNCSISWRILYEDNNHENSNSIVEQIVQVTGLPRPLNYSTTYGDKQKGFISPLEFDKRKIDQKLNQVIRNDGLFCDIDYFYPVHGSGLDFITPSDGSAENLFINIFCTKQGALIEHYPVQE